MDVMPACSCAVWTLWLLWLPVGSWRQAQTTSFLRKPWTPTDALARTSPRGQRRIIAARRLLCVCGSRQEPVERGTGDTCFSSTSSSSLEARKAIPILHLFHARLMTVAAVCSLWTCFRVNQERMAAWMSTAACLCLSCLRCQCRLQPRWMQRAHCSSTWARPCSRSSSMESVMNTLVLPQQTGAGVASAGSLSVAAA